jgi:hypothetical protein
MRFPQVNAIESIDPEAAALLLPGAEQAFDLHVVARGLAPKSFATSTISA